MFIIDPDIRNASTLPSSFYTDSQIFEQTKRKIFERSWHFIGDDSELLSKGSNLPATLLNGFLDEPVLFTRDQNDKLNCISNVCTHRGNLLIEHPCKQNNIRCSYHGRQFNLDGRFVSMPEFEGVQNFPAESDNLKKVPFIKWKQFLFAAINPMMTFESCIKPVDDILDWINYDELRLNSNLSRDYVVKANWALYCENYLEGFHIPFVHHDLNRIIDYGSYTTQLFDYAVLQTGYSKNVLHKFDALVQPDKSNNYPAAFYFWIFPNLMLNFYPWGLSVNVVKPLTPELTRVSFITYISNEKKMENSAGSELDKVEREDEAIVERVQKGIRSRFYHSGRYSPTRETGTHHFHRLIASCFV